MSQGNLELAERVVAAVNERDVDGYLACCADDIKLRAPWAALDGVYEGPEAIRRFFADLQDWAPDFRLTIERARSPSVRCASSSSCGFPCADERAGFRPFPSAAD